MKRLLSILMIVAVLGAVVAAAALVAWRVRLNDQSFYTDAESIEVPVGSADVRDVLWRPAERLSTPVNTDADDLEPRISADGMLLYLVRPSPDGDSDVMISARSANGWGEPQPFVPLNSPFDDLGPTPALDGQSIYFYSNRPGGFGGFDIWRIDRTASGWSEATNLGEGVNSRWNDYGPAISSDGAALYFASDRLDDRQLEAMPDGVELPEALRAKIDYDIYLALRSTGGEFATAAPVTDLNTPADEITPALSPSGDFLYFASDRQGGLGGFDLYRARRVHGEHREPEHFGSEINSQANEIAPALDMAGFAIQFNSDRGLDSEAGAPPLRAVEDETLVDATEVSSDHDIYRALSREVFTARADSRIDWWAIWDALWQSLLWLLLGLILLLALLRYLQKAQFNRLSLLARCALVSLLVHLLIMLLLTAWSVTSTLSELMQADGGTRVALVSHAASQSLESQIRSALTSVEVAAPATTAAPQQQSPSQVEAPAAPTFTTQVTHAPREFVEQSTVEVTLTEAAPPEPTAQLQRVSLPDEAPSTENVNIAVPQERPAQQHAEQSMTVSGAAAAMASRPTALPPSSTATPTTPAAQLAPEQPHRGDSTANTSLAAPTQIRERVAADSAAHSPANDIAIPEAARTIDAPLLPSNAPATPQSEADLRVAGGAAADAPATSRAATESAAAGLPRSEAAALPPAFTADESIDQPLATTAPTLRERESGEIVLGAPPTSSDPALPASNAIANLTLPSEQEATTARAEEVSTAEPGGVAAPSSRALVATASAEPAAVVTPVTLATPPGSAAIDPADSDSLAPPPAAIADATIRETESRAAINDLAAAGEFAPLDFALPAMDETRGATQPDLTPDPAAAKLPATVVAEAALTQSRDAIPLPEASAPHIAMPGDLPPAERARDMSVDAPLFDDATVAPSESTQDLALFVPVPLEESEDSLPAATTDLAPFRLPTELPAPADHALAQRTYEQRAEIIEDMGGSEETERAVADALRWLADHQSDDGRWDGNNFDLSGECGGETTAEVDLALTGLALMAFLASDNTHDKPGPFRDTVQRGLDWLVRQQQPDGSLMGEETLYSHGIATIAICEAFAMTSDPMLRDHAERATRFILESPSPESGGWRYAPGQFGDTSVTGWQVLALASARRGGLELPTDALGHVRDWMERVRDPVRPGRYAYQPQAQYSPAMTAEGMFIRQLLGVPRDDPDMQGSVDFMLANLPEWTREREQNSYYWYYATLAMFHHQGDPWDQWNERLKNVLLDNQRQDGCAAGSWDPIDQWSKIGGRIYQTAICALCLQIYYRFQPIYTSNEIIAPIGTIRGEVRDRVTQEFLPGATIRLDLPDREPITATTDYAGRYVLAAPQMPEFFALSASLPGYDPATATASAEELAGKVLVRNFLLDPLSEHLISIEDDPQVHHVGNDRFEGAINSQFQRQSEGEVWTATFTLTAAQVEGFRDAELILLCKGVQADNIITINGRRLSQRLNTSPGDGSYGEFVTSIERRLLREGENEVAIRSSDSLGDLDDFEFVNVRIRLINPR